VLGVLSGRSPQVQFDSNRRDNAVAGLFVHVMLAPGRDVMKSRATTSHPVSFQFASVFRTNGASISEAGVE